MEWDRWFWVVVRGGFPFWLGCEIVKIGGGGSRSRGSWRRLL